MHKPKWNSQIKGSIKSCVLRQMSLPMLSPLHIDSVYHTVNITMRTVSSLGCSVNHVDGWGLLISGRGVSVIQTSKKERLLGRTEVISGEGCIIS